MTIALRQRPLARVVMGIVKAANGAWFDPSDMTTLYQDAAGTTPVTAVEQPVGLMLDKAQGLMLGPELVSNGTFDSDTVWEKSAGVAITGGVCTFSSVANGAGIYQTLSSGLSTTKMYVVEFTLSGYISGGGISVRLGNSGFFTATNTVNEKKRVIINAGSPSGYLQILETTSNGTYSIDNISVRELYGNHATQSVTASRPVLSARYNLLTYSEQLDNSAWTKANITNSTYPPVVTPNAIVDHTGATTADLVTPANIANSSFIEIYQNGTIISGLTYHQYYCVKPNGWRYLQSAGNGGVFGSGYVNFDLVTGTVTASVPGTGIFSGDITPLTDGWFLIHVSATAIASGTAHLSINFIDGPYVSRGYPATGNGIDGVYVTRADLRVGGARTTYQRVNTDTDYDTDERYFPKYLRFDGVDDYLNLPYMGLYAGGSASAVAGVYLQPKAITQYIIGETTSAPTNSRYGPLLILTTTPPLLTTLIRSDSNVEFINSTNISDTLQPRPSVTSVVDTGNNVSMRTKGMLVSTANYSRASTLTANTTAIGVLAQSTAQFFAQMNLYSLIITKSALTDAQRVRCERYAASKAGVIL